MSEPRTLSPRLEAHFDSIDAAFFTGDEFLDPDNIRRAEWYMDRWRREIQRNREMLAENAGF